MMRYTLTLVTLAALALLAACGGGSGRNADEQAIEEAVRAELAASNAVFGPARTADDFEVFLSHVTDAYLSDIFDFPTTKDEEREAFADGLYLSTPEIEAEDFGGLEVSDGAASVSVTLRQAQSVQRWSIALVKEGDAWLLDGQTLLEQETPGGATELGVEMVDHEYRLSAGTVPAGDVAFQAANEGTVPHDMTVVSLPDGVSVRDAYEASQPQDVGARYVAVFGAIDRGARGTWVLEDLEPGRYGYFCWVPEAGSPHAFLGMAGELTVE